MLLFFQDDQYNLFFVNNNWYLFFRLHEILCQRLYNIHQNAKKIAEDEAQCKRNCKESTAIALRLKAPSKCIFVCVVSLLQFPTGV